MTAVAAASALKVGGDILSYSAQNKQADATKDAALSALKIQDHELGLREVQERIAGSQQIEQGNREVLSAEGDTRADAAARGVGGMTVDLLLRDIARQGGTYRDSVQQNTDASVQATEDQKLAAEAEAKARIAGAPPGNIFATGLKIGSDVLDLASYKIGNKPKGVA